MSEAASALGYKGLRRVSRDERFRDLLAITSMIRYCEEEVAAVSPLAAILLANSKQVLLDEMKDQLASALRKAA